MKKNAIVLKLAAFLILCSPNLFAQWTTNSSLNTPIAVASGDQTDEVMVSDGAGGAIIAWTDNRSGTSDVYAQRINSSGVIQWALNGIVISDTTGNQSFPKIVSDGSGGAIITWEDNRSGNYDIYAQRINASGIAQWTVNGVVVAAAVGNQFFPDLLSDGSGGAIVTWYDYRNGSANADIFAQSINATGLMQWAVNGVALCLAVDNQNNPKIVTDNSGGAIIVWEDKRTAATIDIYAQRINSAGVVQWTVDGIPVSIGPGNHLFPKIVADGLGGAFITWNDNRAGSIDVYAQLINSSGTNQWVLNGIAITNLVSSAEFNPDISLDGLGGIIIAWEDQRSGTSDVYAQRINSLGNEQWVSNGIAVCTSANGQTTPFLISDGSGGVIINWVDNRVGSTLDIYGQKVNQSGIVQWATNGIVISNGANNQQTTTMISDGSGGAIISWMDARSISDFDIYIQNVCANGLIGLTTSCSSAGIEEVNDDNQVVFPNPSNGTFVIELNEISTITISNVLGQFVLSEKLNAGKTYFDLQNQANGIYSITVSHNNVVERQKICITK